MKRLYKKVLYSIILITACFLGYLYFWGYHFPILMYHSISPNNSSHSKLIVNPFQFERQMNFLKKKNYRVISTEELPWNLFKKNKTVILTFDDGYEDNYTYAFPILKKYKFPATIFIVTDWIGKPGYLKWHQIKEMEKQGIRFGNHTKSHAHLLSLSEKDAKKEIEEPQHILKSKLKHPSSIFCYPFGAYSSSIQTWLKQNGYKAALATSSDGFSPLDDPYAFRRIRISNSSDNLWVFWLETSGYYSFIRQMQKKIKRVKKYVLH